jgi:hypothetical protein
MKILPERVLPERVLTQPTLPLTLPTYETMQLIEALGLASYVHYDAIVCRRSQRVKKPKRDVYTG